MKLAIFGATGRTGRHLVEGGLAAGHEVTALVRDPAKLPIQHDRLTVLQGDVTDPAAVRRVVDGAEVVLSALGPSPSSPKDVQTVGTRHILDAMRGAGVRRIVSLTGAGVAQPGDEPKLVDKLFKFALRRLQPDVLADAEGHARAIEASDVDWTIVRAPRLNDGPKRGTYRIGMVGKGTGTQIGRADVADFMLRQVTDHGYVRQAPMVSY